MKKKESVYGFDVLKIFMACMIISIHTKGFEDTGVLGLFFMPFVSTATSVFFILSNFFFFRKVESNGYEWKTFGKFFRRLLYVYMFWFILSIPLLLHVKKGYLEQDFFTIVWYVLRDFTLTSTYPGSWFLTALIVGTLLVFLINKYCCYGRYISLTIGLVLFVYMSSIHVLSESWNIPYLWLSDFLQEDLNLTFIKGIPMCVIGMLFATRIGLKILDYIRDNKIGYVFVVLFAIVFYFWKIFVPESVYSSFFLTLCIIPLFYGMKLPDFGVYVYLRQFSILFFFLHFHFARIGYHINCVPNFYKYVSVLILCCIFSSAILFLRNKKRFYWLNYSF